jgi:hypothetical protein
VTAPVHVTKADLDPLRTWAGPHLLIHPDDPEIVVGAWHEFRDKKCGLMRSTNAGETWEFLDADPSLPSYPFCQANNSNIFHANLAWGRNNTLYMAMPAWDTQDTRNKVSVALARSTDMGDTWTTVLVRDARPTADPNQESNRPVTAVVVDRETANSDTVYVAWRRNMVNQPPGSAVPSQAMLAVSTDGGQTFSDPRPLAATVFADDGPRSAAISAATTIPGTTTTSAPPNSRAAQPNQADNFGGSNPSLTIDDEGTVYAAWKSSDANISPNPPSAIYVLRSTDRGETWTATQVRPFSYANGSEFIIPYIRWSPEGGSQGTLHLVYEGTTRPEVAAYSTIFYVRSTDGGQTWSEPRELPDDDPARMAGKYIPNIDVAPDGRVDVVWWDTRLDPGIRSNDVYYTYSTDNGETWSSNIRVTDQTIDRRFGVWGVNFDQNSPPSLASTTAYALVAWDDTRFSRGNDGVVRAPDPQLAGETFGGGVQDIFVAAVQHRALGGGTSGAAKAVLAGVVGLLAVGLVLLVVVLASRRQAGPPPDRAVKGRTPAGVG